ncbi:MAG: MarR family transcriptional regulator [Acidobacteriia bacterium]|nr:MarR family transcriptional regulator [Terriglobia bacterium]
MPPKTKPKATEDLADRLHSTAIHLLRLVRVQDAAAGIGPAQLSALSVIVFGGPVSLQDLARAEMVRPPTMSRVVDALEAAGLARRKVNSADRRAVLIEATEKGAALLHQGRRRRVKFLARHLSRLTSSELQDIDRAVASVQKALRGQRG